PSSRLPYPTLFRSHGGQQRPRLFALELAQDPAVAVPALHVTTMVFGETTGHLFFGACEAHDVLESLGHNRRIAGLGSPRRIERIDLDLHCSHRPKCVDEASERVRR